MKVIQYKTIYQEWLVSNVFWITDWAFKYHPIKIIYFVKNTVKLKTEQDSFWAKTITRHQLLLTHVHQNTMSEINWKKKGWRLQRVCQVALVERVQVEDVSDAEKIIEEKKATLFLSVYLWHCPLRDTCTLQLIMSWICFKCILLCFSFCSDFKKVHYFNY